MQVSALDGRVVRLPIEPFRRFVTVEGLSGGFAVTFDAQHRLVDLRRVS